MEDGAMDVDEINEISSSEDPDTEMTMSDTETVDNASVELASVQATPSEPVDVSMTEIPASSQSSRSEHLPHPEKNLSKRIRLYQKQHDAAKAVMPHTELAAHRYWIAVLHPRRYSTGQNADKKYTWFKGNRLTTVNTVSRLYSQQTFVDNFVLLLGDMLVENDDQMEHLDLVNDKFVLFRCIEKYDPRAAGVDVTDGLVLEAKPTDKSKEQNSPVEVVVVVDD